MMRTATAHTQQLAVVCLQAQHVAGLPAAAEGRQVLLRLLQQAQRGAAAAMCMGVAAFHDQLLLLHCAPVSTIGGVAVAVMVDGSPRQHDTSVVNVTLAEQLRRPSPRVLSFVLGPSAATTTAGAVLSLTLHHRLITRPPEPQRRRCLLLSCLLPPGPGPAAAATTEEEDGCFDDDDESSGFITIEKGTISRSRRRPPSDNLATTDDDEVDGGIKQPSSNNVTMGYWWPSLNEESKVEDEFLAMLELGGDGLDLDALIKDAEAELARRPTSTHPTLQGLHHQLAARAWMYSVVCELQLA